MNKQWALGYCIIAFMLICAYGQDTVETQKLRLLKASGSSLVWDKQKSEWKPLSKNIQSLTGNTVKTLEKAELHLSLEPAITLKLSENSIINFDKMLIYRSQKGLRMRINIQQGNCAVSMPSELGYTLLFTINTPAASLFISNADFEVLVDQDTKTTCSVSRGSVKIQHTSAENKTVVNAGNRVVVSPNVPNLDVVALEASTKKDIRQTKPLTVAILSVQSSVIPKNNLEPLSDLVAQQIEKKSSAKVLFLDDVKALLRAEGVPYLLNCYTDSCISKIGSFLGVDLVVIGRLEQIGNRFIFNLKMIDALRDATKNRVSAVVDNDIGVLFNEVPMMIDTLVQRSITPEEHTALVKTDSVVIQKIHTEMTWIFPGTFSMGSKPPEGEIDELPLHKVTITGFFIDNYEVTKGEFLRIMGYNPSKFKGCETCPVDNVSWFEAQEYCQKVGKKLPTEAQWEYSCRAGTNSKFHYGALLSSDQANFDGQKPPAGSNLGPFRDKTLPVGSFKPNAWNLYDMHGNVWEWCEDWYDVAYYGNSAEKNPGGPKEGQYKVVRGGGWNSDGAALRSANRISYSPSVRLNTIGFRCVKDTAE